MKISTRGRYGLRAMVDLASQGENRCISLKSIAERQCISPHYLEQLISALKKAGLVKSVRGAGGGYRLSCNPRDVSVGSILKILEGPLYPVDCLSETETKPCGIGSCEKCVTKPVWEKIYESMNDVLNGITLDDLANDYKHIID